MTFEQHGLFWRMWGNACIAQGWDKLPSGERDERRREMLAELGFESIKDVNSTTGFDAVKKRLMELADRVANEPDDAGDRRRLLHCIGELFSDLDAAGYSASAVQTLLRRRFKIVPGMATIPDLPTLELTNLLRTLKARLALVNRRRRLIAFLAFAGFIKSRLQALSKRSKNDSKRGVFEPFTDPFPSPALHPGTPFFLAT